MGDWSLVCLVIELLEMDCCSGFRHCYWLNEDDGASSLIVLFISCAHSLFIDAREIDGVVE
jgi:hypothetical protein